MAMTEGNPLQHQSVGASFAHVFCRYVLRTSNVDAAREFYAQAIGLAVPLGGTASSSSLEVWPLHERARARGAPPHWLGHIAVDDLESMLDRLAEHGSELLGPTASTNEGVRFATLRDPFGSVVAVRTAGGSPDDRLVAWHQLHTGNLEDAWAMYSELFGWVCRQTIDDPEFGGHRLFAWRDAGEVVGSMANTARRPGIHTHWLFYFPVERLDGCITRVRALGGQAFDPIDFLGTLRLSACEDPQGAAFGLVELA